MVQKVEFELIQIEKNYKDDKSIFVKNRTLFIVSRNPEMGKTIFFVNDFYPRLFVEEKENIDFIVDQNKKNIKEIKTEKDENHNFKTLGGEKKLITIYTYTTQDVVDIRDLFAKTYEANIKFTEVFKREKLIKDKFTVPKYVFVMATRKFKINNRQYYMIKQNEIEGRLEF